MTKHLSSEQKRELIRDSNRGMQPKELAEKYGLSYDHTARLVRVEHASEMEAVREEARRLDGGMGKP